jgi:LacI family transcriptional regulator
MPRPLIVIGFEQQLPLPHRDAAIRGVTTYGQANNWSCRLEPGLETCDQPHLPCDGIIASLNDDLAHYCLSHNVPAVHVGDGVPGATVPIVSPNWPAVARVTAQHLLEHGFHRIGFLEIAGHQASAEIAASLHEQLNNVIFRSIRIPFAASPAEWKQAREAFDRCLAILKPPAAVIAPSELEARHFTDHCLLRGFSVPDDFAVLSCRDNDLVCGTFSPGLSAVSIDYMEIGSAAAQLLSELMTGHSGTTFRHSMTVPSVISRRSTDVRPVEDRLIAQALRFINDHSDRPMSVNDVAESLGLNRRTLEKRFRRAHDATINQEIVRSRIVRARRILEETDAPIKVVAPAAGFTSSERMAQVFRRQLNMSPVEYRRARR